MAEIEKSVQSPLEKPLSIAATPSRDPEYFKAARLADGTEVRFADPRATRALVALMDMGAVMGGAASHWGGPAAFAELMSAAHGLMFNDARRAKRPWHDLFLFVNDAGHCENGLYALKANYGFANLTFEELRQFRSIKSRLTGHGETHLFPEAILLSNGPLGSALPQAQGLAMADSLASRADRTTVVAISDGACMEGEAREALAALPGLAARGRLSPFVMIISDNNTKLTGRIDEESFSMAPTFQSLGRLGWEVIDLQDGHDLQACATAIETAFRRARQNPTRPVAIHARTIKGYGIRKTAESTSGGHGFPLKHPSELKAFLAEIYAPNEVPKPFLDWAADLEAQAAASAPSPSSNPQSVKEAKVQVGVSRALIARRKAGLPIISVSADLPGSTGVGDFQKAFPESTRDLGVAESNMVSAAAGLSKLGYIPVVDTFAQFGVTKGALPLTMASLSQAPVIAIYSHVGFQDAADGASHQALSYFSMVGSIPHVRAYALTCSDEAEALVGQAVDRFAASIRAGEVPESYVFFLGRENFPPTYGARDYRLDDAQVVRDCESPKLVIAAAGAMLGQALSAAEELATMGIEAAVLNPSVINRPDVARFKHYLDRCGGRLLTVEDHQVVGGMGSLLIHALIQYGIPVKARSLGVQGEFGQSAYNAIDLYRKHGMDTDAIVTASRKLV